MAKIFKVITNLLLFIFVSIGLIILFSAIPFPGNYKVFTVQSGSMEPTIKTGSLIFVKPSENYEIRDIITRRTLDSKTTITHRIIEKNIRPETDVTIYKTMGDANDAADGETVSPESVIGKVLFDIPYLGYPVGYARTQQGFVLLVIIPAVIIIYEELSKIKKEIRNKMRFRKEFRSRYAKNINIVFHKKEAIDDTPTIIEK